MDGQPLNHFDRVVLSDEIKKAVQSYAQSAEGMMDEGELSELIRSLIFSSPEDSEIILELGTFNGNTASLMANVLKKLNKKNSVVSVDAFDMAVSDSTNPRGSLEVWLTKNAQWGNGTILVRGFTSDVAQFIRPRCVALLVIDAYHEYSSVVQDITMYYPTVKKGGLIFVDDYNEQLYPGVFKATNELLLNNQEVELVKKSYYAIFRKK